MENISSTEAKQDECFILFLLKAGHSLLNFNAAKLKYMGMTQIKIKFMKKFRAYYIWGRLDTIQFMSKMN